MPRGFGGETAAQEARGPGGGAASPERERQVTEARQQAGYAQAQRDKGRDNVQDFMLATGRTETNPYGNEGFFSRVFGIDPKNISYANNIPGGSAGIANLNRLAYDRFTNPYASVNVLGRRVGGDAATGQLREGLSAGDMTSSGMVAAQRRPMSGQEMASRGIFSILAAGTPVGLLAGALRKDPLAIQGTEFYDPTLDPASEDFTGSSGMFSGMFSNMLKPLTGGITYGDVKPKINPMVEGAKQFFQAGQDQTAPAENTRMAFDPKFGNTVYGSDALTPYTYFDGPAQTGSGVPMDREAQGATYRSPDGRIFRDQFEAIESVGIDNINNPIITDIITKPGPGGDLLRQAQQFGSVD